MIGVVGRFNVVNLTIWVDQFLNRCFVTAIGNSSISLAQRQEPLPFSRSQISGKPPMPSNKLAIVVSSPQHRLSLCSTYSHGGRAMLLPMALYRAESALFLRCLPSVSSHAPMSVQLSGRPCKRSHSRGVSRRTMCSMQTPTVACPCVLPADMHGVTLSELTRSCVI